MTTQIVSARTFARRQPDFFVTSIVNSQLFAIVLALVATATDESRPPSNAAPDLVVSPAVIEWQLPERGRSQARIRVANAGATAITVHAGLGSWSLGDDGVARPSGVQPDGLSGRLQVHPARLRLAPGQQRSLRVWLATPAGLSAGEHRALVRLAVPGAGGDMGADSARFDLAIYAWQGPVLAQPSLGPMSWRVCGNRLQARLQAGNTGNRHARLDGWLLVTDAAGAEQRHALPRTPILPGAQQELRLTVPWSGQAPTRLALQGRFGPLDLVGRVLDHAADRTCQP